MTSSRSSASRARRRRCSPRCSASSSAGSRRRRRPSSTRPLYLSFRSTHEVLTAVDEVFGEALATEITASDYTAHASNRPNEPGHVVLLPRTSRQKREEPEDWTEPYTAPSAAETELAERIADEILAIRNTLLPSGKRLSDGDILILVRRRDAFAAAMNRALRARGIPTAGADRIPVSTHIAVLDLLALADVMLLPDDDLQLAACLKSPLLGLSEDAAHAACDGPRSRQPVAGAARRDARSLSRASRRSCGAGAAWPTRSRRSVSSPRCSARKAAAAALPRAARRRGRRRARHVPQPGARLRGDRAAVAAGLRPLRPRQRERHQARDATRRRPACAS